MREWPIAESGPQRFTYPPLVVIEVLSLGDPMVELEQKCDAYEAYLDVDWLFAQIDSFKTME